jgi:hypothetical protein
MAVVMTIAGFLAGVPYALIDITGFLNGAAEQIYIYAAGHNGAQADPGWPQALHYLGHFHSEFGMAGLALAVVGAAAFARVDWRRAAILALFPACLMWILIGERVNFTRNVLSVQPIIAMFTAYGAVVAYRLAVGAAAQRGWMAGRRAAWIRVGAAIVLVAAAVPPWHVRDAVRDYSDSRNVAQAWIAEHIPSDWAVVVPPELGMDVRPLLVHGSRVEVVDFADDPAGLGAQLSGLTGPAVVLLPRWGADLRFHGSERAERRNKASEGWPAIATFGANPVLVNYAQPVPDGNPAFSVAVLQHRFTGASPPS